VSKTSAVEGHEVLKLTDWELGNLHLPPVTTVTLYEGAAPLEFLRSRIAGMLEKKPWLASRIVKKNTADGVVAMTYPKGAAGKSAVEQHFSVYEPGEVALSLDAPYEELVGQLLPVQCARSKPATDQDEVLFKVAVVPIETKTEGVDQPMPLQDSITLPGFALVVSMNHTLGDGHSWLAEEKVRSSREAQVPFVSSNDALTSWFFRETGSDVNIMVANFRSRQPAILDLSDAHVGNYEANVPYFQGDIETPTLIRQSIRDADGAFRAKRAGSPVTEIPGALKLLRNRISIVTNWASFYCDVHLQNDGQVNGESALRPKLHFPIMEPDGFITSVWNNAIIFRPRAGDLAMLMITRRFDNEMLARQKEQDGPFGKRIL